MYESYGLIFTDNPVYVSVACRGTMYRTNAEAEKTGGASHVRRYDRSVLR